MFWVAPCLATLKRYMYFHAENSAIILTWHCHKFINVTSHMLRTKICLSLTSASQTREHIFCFYSWLNRNFPFSFISSCSLQYFFKIFFCARFVKGDSINSCALKCILEEETLQHSTSQNYIKVDYVQLSISFVFFLFAVVVTAGFSCYMDYLQ